MVFKVGVLGELVPSVSWCGLCPMWAKVSGASVSVCTGGGVGGVALLKCRC